MSCVDSTVTTVTPRLEHSDFKSSGVDVRFATTLGIRPLFTRGFAEVVHYQDSPGNATMVAEHPGDRVQVCFLGGPAPTIFCNPDADPRGRTYRIYDYRLRAQYWGPNNEHDCGGANLGL